MDADRFHWGNIGKMPYFGRHGMRWKNVTTWFLISALVCAIYVGCGKKKKDPPPPPPPETWTIFIYGHADHNLSPSLVADIQEMNNATIGTHTTIVVMADYCSGMTNEETGLPFPSGTEWYKIRGSGQSPTVLGTDPEVNADDPTILTAAVESVFSTYPADHYAVVLWDHGGSWDGGFGGDEQDTPSNPADDGTGMTAAQAATAIATALTNAGITGTRPLEFLAFDTCLMAGNEVAYEFRSLAKTFIACAEMDFGDGWDYQNTLTYISSNSKANAVAIATQEVNYWNAHHAGKGPSDDLVRAHVAIDLSLMDAYATAWTNLSTDMYFSASLDWMEVARAQFATTPGYNIELENPNDSPNIRDAGQFLGSLAGVTSDAAVAASATACRTALNNMILSNSLGSLRSAAGQSGVHAELALAGNWTTERRTQYLALNWDIFTGWSDVLEDLEVASDSVAPVVSTTAYNTTDPDASNLPTIEISLLETDVAEGQIFIGAVAGSDLILLGLIGEGPVEPGYIYSFEWDGNLFELTDGTNTSNVFLFRWISGGLYAIPGTLTVDGNNYAAYAILQAGNATVSQVVIEDEGQKAMLSMSYFKGAQFTPHLYDATNDQWLLDTALTILNTANPSLTFSASAAPAGTYEIMTTITDVWGNTGAATDTVTVVTPFGD